MVTITRHGVRGQSGARGEGGACFAPSSPSPPIAPHLPQRATGATKLNEVSSRSHAVCIVIVEKCSSTASGDLMGEGGGGKGRAGGASRALRHRFAESPSLTAGGSGNAKWVMLLGSCAMLFGASAKR